MFKFKKGDKVFITATSTVSSQMVVLPEEHKITDRRAINNTNEYKLKGYVGWWNELNLLSASEGSKNLPICTEAKGVDQEPTKEVKCDTEDSGESENLCNVISELSDLRARFNVFDDEERAKYHALSVAIKKLREACE